MSMFTAPPSTAPPSTAPPPTAPTADVAADGILRLAQPLTLDCGQQRDIVDVHFESWGTLSPARDNVILLCHSLTKTAHAARSARSPTPGWWDEAIGPGRMFDTDRYLIICTDTLAAGTSSGPASVDPATGRPHGCGFPVVTVRDMVRAQRAVLAQLGIERLHGVVGGCFGGQQALEWAISFPDQVGRVAAIAVTPSTSAHSIAVFAVMRHLIRSDPAWNDGNYPANNPPSRGLNQAVAAAIPLWMSRAALEARFGRQRTAHAPSFTIEPEFAVETFLERVAGQPHQGIDANSLMYLTRAVEYFDLEMSYGGLSAALAPVTARTLLVSYANDWRYPTAEMELIHQAVVDGGGRSSHHVLTNALGHGGFMLEFSDLAPLIVNLLEGPDR